MSSKTVNTFIIVFCLISLVQMSTAECRKATHEQTPIGANMFELQDTQTVSNVFGRVLLPDGSAGEDVVVEIFRYAGGENYQDIEKALKRKRIKACVTEEDGRFSFSGLKPGRYLLRAGTLPVRGLNEVHVIIVLTRNSKEGLGKELELKLTLGT